MTPDRASDAVTGRSVRRQPFGVALRLRCRQSLHDHMSIGYMTVYYPHVHERGSGGENTMCGPDSEG